MPRVLSVSLIYFVHRPENYSLSSAGRSPPSLVQNFTKCRMATWSLARTAPLPVSSIPVRTAVFRGSQNKWGRIQSNIHLRSSYIFSTGIMIFKYPLSFYTVAMITSAIPIPIHLNQTSTIPSSLNYVVPTAAARLCCRCCLSRNLRIPFLLRSGHGQPGDRFHHTNLLLLVHEDTR